MRAGALDLAMDLGCLPLCLAQASAVVADSATDCRVYRARLADRTRQMSVTEAGRYTAAVTATWSLSLDRAESGPRPAWPGTPWPSWRCSTRAASRPRC